MHSYLSFPHKVKIVIFGQYKSGTTALCYKIYNSLPPETRLLSEPVNYIPQPFKSYPAELAKVILGYVDGHEVANYNSFMGFDKKIYIVRDPRDWLVSGLLFLIQQNPSIYQNDENLGSVLSLFKQKEEDPESISFTSLLEYVLNLIPGESLGKVTEWMKDQQNWIYGFESRLGEHYRIGYEDFVDGELEGLEEYLAFRLTGEAEVGERNSHVPRTKAYGDWKNWFLPEDVEFFKPLFAEYMERYGYTDDWGLNEKREIKHEHCTGYIERTTGFRRGR